MPLSFTEVNWLAVLVAAVVAFGVGFLWYGPLFGKRWADGMGFGTLTPEQQKAIQQGAMPAYAMSVVVNLVIAWGLAVVFNALGVVGLGSALGVAFVLWAVFTFAPTVNSLFFRGPNSPPNDLYWIDSSHRLALLLAEAAVLALMA